MSYVTLSAITRTRGLFFNTCVYTEVPGYTSNNYYYMGFMCLPRKVVVVVVLRTTSILIHIKIIIFQCIFLNSNRVLSLYLG